MTEDFVLGLLGDIKKAYMSEVTRLKMQGVTIRMKPVWQAIHQSEHAVRRRCKKLLTNPEEK